MFLSIIKLFNHRDIVVTSAALATLRTLPVLVPDVVTQVQAPLDRLVAGLLGGAPLAHIILFLSPLRPVWCGGPGDGGQTSVLVKLTGLDSLGALLCVPVLLITNITLETGD